MTMFIHFFCVPWSPVYTDPDKHLHGKKLPQLHLAFTRDRRIFEPRVCGPGQIFARTNPCTASAYVYTRPAELDEFLNS